MTVRRETRVDDDDVDAGVCGCRMSVCRRTKLPCFNDVTNLSGTGTYLRASGSGTNNGGF